MKTRSRHPHDSLQTALRCAFPLDGRRLEVLTALILAMVQARSVVLYTLKTHVHLPGSFDTRYQRLRRFVRFEFPDHFFVRFALFSLPDGELNLILDRTNWKLGKQDVNILLLSAVWDSFSLPLVWALLPHGGSSSHQERFAHLLRFVRCCSERHIGSLLADREFIGKSWFTFLDQHGIAPCIRLPATATIGTGKLPVSYGVSSRLCATKNTADEVLYLAYRGYASVNLRRYAQRWQAENLHSALKTRGFNLEDTGLTQAERVSTVLTCVSAAFIWAYVTCQVLAAKQPVKRKEDGYRAVSVFRLGLDHLQDLLLHPSLSSWRALQALMPSFDW
ncbi:IS4-like element ISDds2 family transposase [Deinococcus deserti]|uniref:Putative transposase n=1 Tax=Deinococcus deserti (strain DSM 17065 / CIP 109153 / LMG 22923 / VCD115) TaxID=546414 RepID=C1D0Y0_DEIDV|nr:IS4-like element ISDds2 family transposase [Deinococcus deserti]ACO45504.1 putative transposase [Deinococcus deserti VCD115]